MSMATAGTELLKQLMEGEFNRPAPETVTAVRTEVVPALAELIDRGFRARPLMLGGEHVGMVRGLHITERRQLFTWFPKPEDRIQHLLALATTLTLEEVNTLDGYEAQALLQVIDKLTDADLSLYPYISAFSTTSISEVIWYARGAGVAGWDTRTIKFPGGWQFDLLAAPDHARLWAGVAELRERSKRRLDETYNAAMITRALTGKGSDKLYASLKKHAQSLQADATDPWMQIVRADIKNIDFDDGWGHTHQDDSVEGIMREVEGMAKMDKHEKFMADFYKRQMDEAQRQEDDLNQRFERALAHAGIEDDVAVLTDVQVRDMDARAKDRKQQQEDAVTEAMIAANVAEERREGRHTRKEF